MVRPDDVTPASVAAVVLAAGSASRFGGGKLLAPFDGRPILQHVLDALSAARVGRVVVVVPPEAGTFDAAIRWRDERRVMNARPEDGLASSVRAGFAAIRDDGVRAALVVLGDQPLLRGDVIDGLIGATSVVPHPILVPRYAGGGGPNPVLIRAAAWGLVDDLEGDRGFGPLIASRPGLVHVVDVPGANPDVDTADDLARLSRGEA
jgi:molybdenum cofactor cytidylyltransferase